MIIDAFLSRFDPGSLRLQRQLQVNQRSLELTIERLSSGLRLNRGADEPPGLARKVENQLRSTHTAIDGPQILLESSLDGLNQTQLNFNSEIGLLTRAEINVQAAAASLHEQPFNQQRVFELLFGQSSGFGLGGFE